MSLASRQREAATPPYTHDQFADDVADIAHAILLLDPELHDDTLPGGTCEACPADAQAALDRLSTFAERSFACVNADPLHEALWKAAEVVATSHFATDTDYAIGRRLQAAVEALRYLHGEDTTAHEHEWELAYIDTGGEHYRCRDCGASSTALPIPPTRPQRGIVEDTTGGEG